MEVKEFKKKSVNTMAKPEAEAMMAKLKKEHSVLKKGMFEFVDAQGGWLDFSYRFFKDDPLMTIRLVHGEICELPMGIIRHLNNTYKKVRTLNSEVLNGKDVTPAFVKTSRIRFTPMDVM